MAVTRGGRNLEKGDAEGCVSRICVQMRHKNQNA